MKQWRCLKRDEDGLGFLFIAGGMDLSKGSSMVSLVHSSAMAGGSDGSSFEHDFGGKADMHLMPKLLSIECLAAIEPFKSEVREQGTDIALCHGARVRRRQQSQERSWTVQISWGGPGRPRSPKAEEVLRRSGSAEEVLRRSERLG